MFKNKTKTYRVFGGKNKKKEYPHFVAASNVVKISRNHWEWCFAITGGDGSKQMVHGREHLGRRWLGCFYSSTFNVTFESKCGRSIDEGLADQWPYGCGEAKISGIFCDMCRQRSFDIAASLELRLDVDDAIE
jgi:hypothetical protein